jgi:hypothetical protein
MNRDQLLRDYRVTQSHLASTNPGVLQKGHKEEKRLLRAIRPEIHAKYGDPKQKALEISQEHQREYLRARVHRRNTLRLDFRTIPPNKGEKICVMTPAEFEAYIRD